MVKVKVANSKTDKSKPNYSLQDISNAIETVKKGLSIRTATSDYGILYESLRGFINEGLPEQLRQHQKCVLTSEEATKAAQDATQPLNKTDVRLMVKEFLDSMVRETRLANNLPGKK